MKHPIVIIIACAACLAFDDDFMLVRQDFLLLDISARVVLLSILSISSADEEDSLSPDSLSRASFLSTCLSCQSFVLGADCDELLLLLDVSTDLLSLSLLSLNDCKNGSSRSFVEGLLFQNIKPSGYNDITKSSSCSLLKLMLSMSLLSYRTLQRWVQLLSKKVSRILHV